MPKKLRPLGDDWLLKLRTLKVKSVEIKSVAYTACEQGKLHMQMVHTHHVTEIQGTNRRVCYMHTNN
jgi:hypothetical protein